MDDIDDLDDVLDGRLDSPASNQPIPSTLIALCILTMIGSVFILLKDYITFQYLEGEDDLLLIYAAEFLGCIASITAAILMLVKKLIGFYIYIASNVIYIAAVLWFWLGMMNFNINAWSAMLIFVYVAAPVGFTVMYSTHKKYLH
ncbi:MAG: hypothetical protein NXI10_15775 [bacterium]|nr:hypothetical protein [bacterium]